MAQQILQVNFQFNAPAAEFETMAERIASHFAVLPGLQWKIWLINRDKKEAGGLYLFQDEAAVQAYLQSNLFASGPANEMFSHLSVKQFSVLEAPGLLTNAPIARSFAGQS